MLNPHQFQQSAKQFRAGRITLEEFTDQVFAESTLDSSDDRIGKGPQQSSACPAKEREVPKKASPFELARLPQRSGTCHKGDLGRILVIGGADGMAGAIGMTGLAALRSGAGLVKVAVPDLVQRSVENISPCLMTIGCPSVSGFFSESASKKLVDDVNWADVVAMGPGMGRGVAQQNFVTDFYNKLEIPMVVDADGLNALSDSRFELGQHAGDRVLTPHAGEFQRLAGCSTSQRSELEKAAKQMAGSASVVVVLKGAETYVTDGTVEFRNNTGNPGMATAGCGDVLTGVISSLIGQGLSVLDASALGVHIHGLAGDFAEESLGEVSMIATDLLMHLAGAFKEETAKRANVIGF